jgi:heme exporter protein C
MSKSLSPRWFHYAAPQNFFHLSAQLWPWCAGVAVALGLLGLYLGLLIAPVDAQQGEAYRIIFVHVPASWMSMVIYMAMAFWSIMGLVFNTRLSALMTRALAPTGAMFAFISLFSGALWGKPMWGTWWVWDARLTSELLLFFLYLGYIALTSAIEDSTQGDRAGALIAVVGSVNVPIIYFSVKWWNTLHQGSSITMGQAPSMAQLMLWAMLLMALSFWAYTLAVVFYRVRVMMLRRERQSHWLRAWVSEQSAGGHT